MRTVGQARPAAASPSIVGLNSDGAVDRKIATPWHGSPIVSASRSKPAGIVDVERDVMEPARNRSRDPLPGRSRPADARCSAASARSRKAASSSSVRAVPTILKLVRQQPVGVQPVERRQQHPPRKVASRAEQQQRGNLLDHARLLQKCARRRKGRNVYADRYMPGRREGVAVGVEIAQVAAARLLAEPGDEDQRDDRRHDDDQRDDAPAPAPAPGSRATARTFRRPWCRPRPCRWCGRGCAAGSFPPHRAAASRSARWCRRSAARPEAPGCRVPVELELEHAEQAGEGDRDRRRPPTICVLQRL